MRIVLFADGPARGRDAAGAILDRVADDLMRLGHEVALVVASGMPPSRAAVLQVRLQPFPFPWLAPSGVRALDAFAPQVVHVLTSRPICMLARAYAQRHALPFVMTLHADYPGSARHCGAIEQLLDVYRDAGAPLGCAREGAPEEAPHRPSGVYSVSSVPLSRRI